ELLPSQRYGAGWLRVTCNGKELLQLPRSSPDGIDPYTQIYLEPDAWWRLMDPAWIDPVDTEAPSNVAAPSLTAAWMAYRKQLNRAKSFHADLGDYYHPHS
ncbi:alpha/beta hydrolase, partial [Pseudomonas citronellolis]|nr:alpha/beta hydrolase [Pseudomonas citronellolis]